MKPSIKRGLTIAALSLLAVVAIPASLIGSAFLDASPIADGLELEGTVRIVKDGYVAIGVIDLGDGKVALVDTGNDPSGRALLAELRRRDLGPEAVSDVLFTHGHSDHIAGSHLFPSASFYALEPDVALAEGRAAPKSPLGKLTGAPPSKVKITRPLDDGETLVLGKRTVRVFGVPGHTAGSAAYLVDGVLFVGDSASATTEGRIMPAAWFFSEDTTQNRRSLKDLAERLDAANIDVKAIVPAHSGVVKGLSPLLTFAQRR